MTCPLSPTERVYALSEAASSFAPEDLASANPEDHMRWFTVFRGWSAQRLGRYLAGDVDLLRDGVGYRQVSLGLTDQELAELAWRLNAALAPVIANRPAPDRQRRMLATILMPTPPADGHVKGGMKIADSHTHLTVRLSPL